MGHRGSQSCFSVSCPWASAPLALARHAVPALGAVLAQREALAQPSEPAQPSVQVLGAAQAQHEELAQRAVPAQHAAPVQCAAQIQCAPQVQALNALPEPDVPQAQDVRREQNAPPEAQCVQLYAEPCVSQRAP